MSFGALHRALAGAGATAGAVIQACRRVGPARVDDAVRAHVARTLSDEDRRALGALRRTAPGWLRPVLARIAGAPGPREDGSGADIAHCALR